MYKTVTKTVRFLNPYWRKRTSPHIKLFLFVAVLLTFSLWDDYVVLIHHLFKMNFEDLITCEQLSQDTLALSASQVNASCLSLIGWLLWAMCRHAKIMANLQMFDVGRPVGFMHHGLIQLRWDKWKDYLCLFLKWLIYRVLTGGDPCGSWACFADMAWKIHVWLHG